MPYAEQVLTFRAGEDLAAKRRVKIDTGGSQSPIDVIYADAGESAIGVTQHAADDTDLVSVKLMHAGSIEVEAGVAFTVGATAYGAADGKISTVASGSAVGVVKAAVSGAGSIAELIPYPFVSTTAATVSIADTDNHTSTATVEAALAEIYQDLLSAQRFIPVSLMQLREASTMDVGAIAANGGVLASDTTPVMEAINAATDGCQRLNWVAGNTDQVIFQVPLPPDFNAGADLVLHIRAAMSDTNNTPTFGVDSWFNEGDTKVSDTSGAVTGTSYAEYTATIAHADIPAGAQTLSVGLTPAAHANDALYLTAVWLEYSRSILTS